MWEIFNPILSWLRDLLDNRLTAARAAKLDFLDAGIGTRAPASTAVSSASYTATRAAYLDNLAIGGAVAAAHSPVLAPPMTNGLVMYSPSTGQLGFGGSLIKDTWPHWITHATGNVGTTFEDVVNISGRGIVSFAAVQEVNAGSSGVSTYMDIIIDGATVISYGQVLQSSAAGVGPLLIGALGGTPTYGFTPVFEPIPFETSLQIRVKSSNAAYPVQGCARVRRSA